MTKSRKRQRRSAPPVQTPIHPDVDWQASVLAEKVRRRVMSLEAAARELDDWQDEAGLEPEARPRSRSLIVTHMLNAMLKRGF